jgi:hypothetical protein
MSLACEPNKSTPSYFARKEQQTSRNLGLSPVFNVNTEMVACIENFVGPEYDCDNGMCEPVTGLTIGCPDGYTKACGNDICIQTTTTGATATAGSGTTITVGIQDADYCSLGAYFYENVQDREFPIIRTDPYDPDLVDNTGGTITTTNTVSGDTFWDSDGSSTQGRLNLTGFVNLVSEYRGVSYCFEECSATTYYIGFGANGLCRLTIDGEEIVDFNGVADYYNSYIWHVIPWNFSSGKHIIELEGSGNKNVSMEIYKPSGGLNQLTGATTSGDTGVVFTMADRIGTTYDLGVTAGYTCPTGYSMDTCGSGLTCTLLDYTDLIDDYDPPCLYNLNEINNFSVTFDFTSGNTMYTGYTGEFCYSVINTLPGTTIPSVCTPYDEITGSSITKDFTVDTNIATVDNTYRVRSWDRFVSKCLTNDVGNTGITVDTEQFVDIDKDCYFVTVTNPPKPLLEFQPIDALEGISFVNETLNVIPDTNQVLLSSYPVGNQVLLSVNGITVSTSDYTLDLVDSRLITINTTLEGRDVISAAYNTNKEGGTNGISNDSVKLEIFSVTGVTTGVTSSFSATTYENIVNYNSTNNRTEIYLKEKIDPSVQPRLTINGVNLQYEVDFFRSNIVDNKLILNEGSIIEIGDIVSIYYYYTGVNNPGDLGKLRTATPTIQWSSQTNVMKTSTSNGEFTLEVTDRDDVGFNNILKSSTTLYNNSLTSYTLDVDTITTTSIKNYIYRIKFTKNFSTRNPVNVYTTETYSDTGSFRLDWSYINNTNF